ARCVLCAATGRGNADHTIVEREHALGQLSSGWTHASQLEADPDAFVSDRLRCGARARTFARAQSFTALLAARRSSHAGSQGPAADPAYRRRALSRLVSVHEQSLCYHLPALRTTSGHLMHKSFAFLLLVMLLAGCGQKGPLYLPEQKPAA